ncbi:MAG: uncharacterized protein A8A55_1103 [Amphiamblys sp. WSBS2006]|nr:MAG: uncharacterized protein A8A55_1103 [Amphiamblys sp. WSBS2006]
MLSLQELSFARYEDNYFLNSGDGFLVIPKTFLSEYEHVKTFKDSPPEDKTKTAVDNKLVGKALKFFQENVDPSSVFSMKNKTKEDSTVDNKFFEKILDSIREKTSPSSVGSGGNKTFDDFLREKKAEEASDIVLIKKALDSIREKTSPSSVFSLENTSSNKVFFINMQTVVTLENATISDNLLITFLTEKAFLLSTAPNKTTFQKEQRENTSE